MPLSRPHRLARLLPRFLPGFRAPAGVLALALALVLALPAVSASAGRIDFESDEPGFRPNGFRSSDSPLVRFTDSAGEGLEIRDLEEQGMGLSLQTLDDFDDSELVLDFGDPVITLSLAFGNDDPLFSNEGDRAVLTAFADGAEVGRASVVMNRKDVMDQTITFSGPAFDRATFKFDVDPGRGLIEVVDDIQFTAVIPVPPAAWGGLSVMAGLSLSSAARRALRRRTR